VTGIQARNVADRAGRAAQGFGIGVIPGQTNATIQGMKIPVLMLMLVLVCTQLQIAASAQECQFGGAEAFDATAKALSEAKSCAAAASIMRNCAWGSSADSQLAPIAIGKCEKSFFDKLSEKGKERYGQEMQLCAYEFAKQEGTMYISAAALCQVDVAARFASNPAEAEEAVARASFDCGTAKTPLESAICSDIRLGKADIVLSRVYGAVLKGVDSAHRPEVIQSQKEWLRRVPVSCGLSARSNSPLVMNCLRNEFERRFTDLDGCADETLSCLKAVDADEREGEAAVADNSKPRASFDCEKPLTALEIVICADSRLGEADIDLANAYAQAKSTMGSQQQGLIDSERRWLRYVPETCPLGTVGGIPPLLARSCVRSALEVRIQQLKSCPEKKEAQERLQCLNHFHVLENE